MDKSQNRFLISTFHCDTPRNATLTRFSIMNLNFHPQVHSCLFKLILISFIQTTVDPLKQPLAKSS